DAVGWLTRDRQLALTLEFLDRGLSVRIDDSARLDLAVTVFSKRSLQRDHAFRSRRPLDDTIVTDRRRTRCGCSSGGPLRRLGRRSHDGLQQRLVRLAPRLESGGLLEISDRSVSLRAIKAIDDAIVVAAARQFALDIVDDLSGRTGRGRRGDLGRRRGSCRLERPRTRNRRTL